LPRGNSSSFFLPIKSKYNKGDSAGYSTCHVIEILGGRERNKEREESWLLAYSPAVTQGLRKRRLHAVAELEPKFRCGGMKRDYIKLTNLYIIHICDMKNF
jgi:hypothetical protein